MSEPPATGAAGHDPGHGLQGWERIGYHRVTGAFYWNIIFAVFAIAYVMILPLLIPYPESMGYYTLLTSIFRSFFTFADLGTASALSRFIAEWRVKDPARTIMYVRFFIWFQAFSGLTQTTIVSAIGLFALGATNLSYMPWLFVWLSTIQYPGWLGVFKEALNGFQQYGRVALAGLLNMVVFQTVTLALGAQLGAWFGNQDPRIGGVLGASIGMVIGYYVDDFMTVVVEAKMFSVLLKPMGYKTRDLFKPTFSKEIAKESIKFGLGVMGFVLSYESIGTIVAFIYAAFLPNYATYIGILAVLNPIMGLAETVNGMHVGNHRATVCEAHFNGKHNYAVYLLSNGFRTIGQVTGLITPLALVAAPAIVDMFFPAYMTTFSRVFIPVLVFKTIFQHSHFMNEVLIGTGHHRFNIAITVLEQVVSLVAVITCIWLQLGIFVLVVPGYAQTFVKQGIGWIYINRRIINLRFNPWQNWVATGLAGVLYWVLLSVLFTTLLALAGTLVAGLAVFLLGIYVLPGPCYFLPLALLGGYDALTMEDFKNAVELAGPSKLVVVPWYRCAALGARLGKLHGRFPMYHDRVGEEIAELTAMKIAVDSAGVRSDR